MAPPTDWLLLHGLGCTAAYWRGFPTALAAATGARVHLLDHPGVGRAADRPMPGTVAGMVAEDRARWLETRGGGTWGLLGLSLGGMVAMEWAARHGGDFDRLVLVSSSAADLGWPWQRLTPRGTAVVARVLATGDARKRHRLVSRLTLNDPARRAEAVSAADEVTRNPVSRRGWAIQLAAATRYRSPTRVEVPTLALAGGGDRMVSPACSRHLAAKLSAELHVRDGAGHDLPTDAGAWVAERVAAWAR